MDAALNPAAAAFDAIAGEFDARFAPWLSVEAQRGAVRQVLLAAFAPGSRLLELGGGTGTDAAWMIGQGREVFVTDASPRMMAEAALKIGHSRVRALAAEELEHLDDGGARFDGAYSNFAALNCVTDLVSVRRALARLVRPGGEAVLVVFGTCSVGEAIVEALRGRFGACFRRLKRGPAAASLGGRRFEVRYHRQAEIVAAMSPAFRLVARTGIGLFVPPSAAEPWISRHPRLLAMLAALDRVFARPLAPLSDHVLYRFVRVAGAE